MTYRGSEISEKEALEWARKDGVQTLKLLDNPTEAVQLEAVRQYGLSILYIDNPTEEMNQEAFRNTVYAIKYIKNPSEAMKLQAVRKNGLVILDIENPSEAVKIEAVKQNSEALRYIENPSLEVLKHAGTESIINLIDSREMLLSLKELVELRKLLPDFDANFLGVRDVVIEYDSTLRFLYSLVKQKKNIEDLTDENLRNLNKGKYHLELKKEILVLVAGLSDEEGEIMVKMLQD